MKQIGHAILTVDLPSGEKEEFLITLPRLRIDGLWYGSPYIELTEFSYIQSSSGWLSTVRPPLLSPLLFHPTISFASSSLNHINGISYRSNTRAKATSPASPTPSKPCSPPRGPTTPRGQSRGCGTKRRRTSTRVLRSRT